MIHIIYNKLSVIVRAIFAVSLLLLTINAKAQDLPSLPSLDDLELPELNMGGPTDTPESVSRPTSTMQQSFNKDLPPMPELEDDLAPPPNIISEEDPLALPPLDSEPELPIADELTLPEQSEIMNEDFPNMVEENTNKESWWSTVKGWIGLNEEEGQQVTTPPKAFDDNNEISQTMSDIDDMLNTPTTATNDPVDQLLEAPTLDDLDMSSIDKQTKAPEMTTDDLSKEQAVKSEMPQEAPSTQEFTEKVTLPVEKTQKASSPPLDNTLTAPVSDKDSDDPLSLPMMSTENNNPPSDNALTPLPGSPDTANNPTIESDEETWSEMFARIWHNFKVWVGLAEEEVVEVESGIDAEYADENLELFDDPLTPKSEVPTSQPAIEQPQEEPIISEPLNEKQLDIVATEEPSASPILQDQAQQKQEEPPQEPEDPFVKIQNNFVQKEMIVLMMRNDDIVLGQTTRESLYHYMNPRQYIHEFWKEFEWEARALDREKIQQFVNYYYNYKSLPTMLRRKQMQQYNDDIIVATYKGDLKTIRVLLQNYPELIDANDLYGNNLLHIAVYKKYYEIAKFLIMSGIEIDPYNEFMETPLDMTPENSEISRLLYRAL